MYQTHVLKEAVGDTDALAAPPRSQFLFTDIATHALKEAVGDLFGACRMH
jgi:hypothetical protein